ncbi:hypothetical protein CN692_21325 [Bacillus sp. AFS002410]|uniref:hypothetical protein n=1 Tax=Bacillus sp. AFS002410 TaxID=2033481 RepID=UPI000BF064DD|nr:hypothetical protein [Bacillus sp. AFS002410]PEJ53291.1 hypothetical protein CN692_21325 [Bacillus sp. AFS002410]
MEYLFIGLLFIIFMLSITNRLNALEKRLKYISTKLDLVAAQVKVPEHPINDELRKLKQDGEIIKAVREARNVFGLSLLEAKQYVDNL